MLKSLKMNEFTVFQDASLEFSSGLNVIIGENGLGKSHIIKLGYSLSWMAYEAYRSKQGENSELLQTNDAVLSVHIADKLARLFRPEKLGRLVHRRIGRSKTDVTALFESPKGKIDFSFATNSKEDVKLTEFSAQSPAPSVFIPAGDVISMMPFLKDAWAKYPHMLDASYNDLSDYLNRTVPAGAVPQSINPIMKKLEKVLGGKIILENGRFYIREKLHGKVEMPLIAEGLRKIAMLGHLVANRSIENSSILFWDEPECNLNPKMIRVLADVLFSIANTGTQVILATHSLFLLREFDLLIRENKDIKTNARFFALDKSENDVNIQASDTVDNLSPLVSLDEEISQSERYMQQEG